MFEIIKLFVGLACSYLVGSIPTAYIFGKVYKGIDIREHGSKNVGATNVFRVLGKIPGAIVLFFDIAKGVFAVVVVSFLFGLDQTLSHILLGVASVCGHNWTIFLSFKGGKGVATSLGVLIGLAIQMVALRLVLLLVLFVWLVVFLIFGYVSLASMVAVIFLPLLLVIFTPSFELLVLGVMFCVFVLVRHQPNIRRLLEGKEPRVQFPFRHRP